MVGNLNAVAGLSLTFQVGGEMRKVAGVQKVSS